MTATETSEPPRRVATTADVDRQVSKNLPRLREGKGLSTTKLAALLEDAGQPIPATGITRIEKGQRRVTAAELFALAKILKVTPLDLAGQPGALAARAEQVLFELALDKAASGDPDYGSVSRAVEFMTPEHMETVTRVLRATEPTRQDRIDELKKSFGDK